MHSGPQCYFTLTKQKSDVVETLKLCFGDSVTFQYINVLVYISSQ